MKIESWLSNLGLNEYISLFKENEITFDDLLTLTSEDLKTELGITKLIDRKKIIQAISELNLNENNSEKLSNYLEVEKIPFCLFEPFHEFKKEKHPRVKLFWLIDTSEYAIKFIVSILFSEILFSMLVGLLLGLFSGKNSGKFSGIFSGLFIDLIVALFISSSTI